MALVSGAPRAAASLSAAPAQQPRVSVTACTMKGVQSWAARHWREPSQQQKQKRAEEGSKMTSSAGPFTLPKTKSLLGRTHMWGFTSAHPRTLGEIQEGLILFFYDKNTKNDHPPSWINIGRFYDYYSRVLQRGDRRNRIFLGGGCIPPRRDQNKSKGGCLGVYWTPSVA